MTHDYNDTVAAGDVISQSPAKGTQVDKGAAVSFVLSQGPPLVSVPKVVGLSDADAIKALQAAGFSPLAGASQFDKSVPLGQVISQTPGAGVKAPKGSSVTYVVSKGAQMAVVPDVTGQSKSDAIAAIQAAGFKYSVSYDYSDSVDSGDVISQSPSGGGSYPAKSTVTITVSNGPKLVKVPDLVGMARELAISTLKDLGLSVNVVATGTLQDGNSTYSGTVLKQDPAAGKKVNPKDSSQNTVTITVDEATEPPQ